MRALAPFEPATPAMIVGRSMGDAVPALGLGEPMALLGGDRLGPNGIPLLVMHDHQPAFRRWVGQSCHGLLAAERPWFSAPPLILTSVEGAGRTHAARRLAQVAGVPHAILNLTDPVIAANVAASGAVGEALWASPVTVAMAASGCANPIVSVLGADQVSDDVAIGLLAMIDPATSHAWREDRLGIVMDYGEVSWILQCSKPAALPATILTRAAHVRLEPPPARARKMLTLSILAEVLHDLDIAPGSSGFGWGELRDRLPNDPRRLSARQIYADTMAAVRGVTLGGGPPDADHAGNTPF